MTTDDRWEKELRLRGEHAKRRKREAKWVWIVFCFVTAFFAFLYFGFGIDGVIRVLCILGVCAVVYAIFTIIAGKDHC